MFLPVHPIHRENDTRNRVISIELPHSASYTVEPALGEQGFKIHDRQHLLVSHLNVFQRIRRRAIRTCSTHNPPAP